MKKIKKAIFLDIDGVLKPFGQKDLSKVCVKNLHDVLVATGAFVIISSDWRIGGIGIGSDLHKKLLQADGGLIFNRIVGATDINDKSRRDQINDFMINNGDIFDIDHKIVVIDDDSDVGDIVTAPSLGFTSDCVDRVLKWLED
jgi:hypothetical protein